jgi:hypothetical protein
MVTESDHTADFQSKKVVGVTPSVHIKPYFFMEILQALLFFISLSVVFKFSFHSYIMDGWIVYNEM